MGIETKPPGMGQGVQFLFIDTEVNLLKKSFIDGDYFFLLSISEGTWHWIYAFLYTYIPCISNHIVLISNRYERTIRRASL